MTPEAEALASSALATCDTAKTGVRIVAPKTKRSALQPRDLSRSCPNKRANLSLMLDPFPCAGREPLNPCILIEKIIMGLLQCFLRIEQLNLGVVQVL